MGESSGQHGRVPVAPDLRHRGPLHTHRRRLGCGRRVGRRPRHAHHHRLLVGRQLLHRIEDRLGERQRQAACEQRLRPTAWRSGTWKSRAWNTNGRPSTTERGWRERRSYGTSSARSQRRPSVVAQRSVEDLVRGGVWVCSRKIQNITRSHFVDTARDITALYLNPPDAWCCTVRRARKPRLQAMDHTAPVLLLMPGMPQRFTRDLSPS